MADSSSKESSLKKECSAAPAGPCTPPRQLAARRQLSPSPRKPWVSAEWKQRVPSPPARPKSPETVSTLHTAQRAALVAERKQQLSADYACVHGTIDRILSRCQSVQERLSLGINSRSNSSSSSRGVSRPSNAAAGISSPQNVLYMTMRSQLLFEPPLNQHQPTAKDASSSPCNAALQQHHTTLTHAQQQWQQQPAQAAAFPQASSAQLGKDGAASAGGAGVCESAHQQQKQQGEQQQKEQQHGQRAGWHGAVDLNPGFSFRPGTPERLGAVMRGTEQQPGLKSNPDASNHSSKAAYPSASCTGQHQLTHREVLQSGIQQLNGEFYDTLKEQQKQQLINYRDAVVPASWFGP